MLAGGDPQGPTENRDEGNGVVEEEMELEGARGVVTIYPHPNHFEGMRLPTTLPWYIFVRGNDEACIKNCVVQGRVPQTFDRSCSREQRPFMLWIWKKGNWKLRMTFNATKHCCD
jgi:hypothetical protein